MRLLSLISIIICYVNFLPILSSVFYLLVISISFVLYSYKYSTIKGKNRCQHTDAYDWLYVALNEALDLLGLQDMHDHDYRKEDNICYGPEGIFFTVIHIWCGSYYHKDYSWCHDDHEKGNPIHIYWVKYSKANETNEYDEIVVLHIDFNHFIEHRLVYVIFGCS